MVFGQPVPIILASVFDMYFIPFYGMPEIKFDYRLDPACGVGLNAQGCGVVSGLRSAGEETAAGKYVSDCYRLAVKRP